MLKLSVILCVFEKMRKRGRLNSV